MSQSKITTRQRLIAYGELLPEVTQCFTRQEYRYYVEYTEGLTLAEVGKLNTVSAVRVRQVLSKVESKFKRKANKLVKVYGKLKELSLEL